MIGTFKKFKEYEQAEMEKYRLNDMIPQAFQSHPALDKRISRLESKWKKIRNPAAFIELDASAWHTLKEPKPKSEH
jgi:predicted Zn-dependent protease